MTGRQTLMRPCRIHGTKPPIPMTSFKGSKKFCYYCWLKGLADKNNNQIRPEERLLAQIFGSSRHLQTISKGYLQREKRRRQAEIRKKWLARRLAKRG